MLRTAIAVGLLVLTTQLRGQDRNLELVLDQAIAGDALTVELKVRQGSLAPGTVMGRGHGQGRHIGTISGVVQDGERLKCHLDLQVRPDLWIRGGQGSYDLELIIPAESATCTGSFTGQYAEDASPLAFAPRRGRVRLPDGLTYQPAIDVVANLAAGQLKPLAIPTWLVVGPFPADPGPIPEGVLARLPQGPLAIGATTGRVFTIPMVERTVLFTGLAALKPDQALDPAHQPATVKIAKPQSVIAYTTIETPEDGVLYLSFGADWSTRWHVDGRVVYDTLSSGNQGPATAVDTHAFALPITRGSHVLAVQVVSGSLGWSLTSLVGFATKAIPGPSTTKTIGLAKSMPSKPVQGTVTGRLTDAWPVLVPGHIPVAAGEHPRLCFRKADLPLLKKRAETPEGKAFLDRFRSTLGYTQHDRGNTISWRGIGLGFAWQMTGDRAFADQARDLVQRCFFSANALSGGQDIHFGPRLQGLALIFDLCYDAWDPAFRQQCIDAIWLRVQECRIGASNGTKMGGLNMAYWSNHNGVRSSAMGLGALAVLRERLEDGRILEDDALEVAREAAFDSAGWLRAGCGGGAWFCEGMHYKGMTMYRGLLHLLHAYPLVLGERIADDRLGRFLIAGHVLEAEPGRPFVAVRSFDGCSDNYDIDGDNLLELIWTMGWSAVPPDLQPAMKWLHTRSVGLAGDKTFRLDRACYAPYFMAAYPFDLKEQEPAAILPWLSPDPVNGHWVFRPIWKDDRDVLLTWNLLSHVRGSSHNERVGPSQEWRLWGLGQQWLEGRVLPTVTGYETVSEHPHTGIRCLNWREKGRIAQTEFDLSPAWLKPITKPRDSKASWDEIARQAGGLKAVFAPDVAGPRADLGISGRRSVAVDASGACGAPLLVALIEEVDRRTDGDPTAKPAAFTWRLPFVKTGSQVQVDGQRFTITRGTAVISGLMLGGNLAPDLTATVTDGRLLVVFWIQNGPATTATVTGEGLKAQVRIGGRTVACDGGRVVLGAP